MVKKTLTKPETIKVPRSRSRKKETAGKVECLCLECGISNYLELEGQALDALVPEEAKILVNIFCSECGGPLLVRGKAGAEPFYDVR
ncbi:MAG: hypothetical protein HY892_01940 [Deltaproteobacteria bacterium]|nr:hypothetical protein [Deltaproteobacteria bacterium]